jgi:2-oxoglutarate ferredoxin oxidoreductase subunit delta
VAKIIINSEKCKACGLCCQVCPKNIIKFEDEKVNSKGFKVISIIEPKECIGCAQCAIICPDCVIEVLS